MVNIHSIELPESKVRGSKFERIYDGPFEITERVSPVAYRVRLPHGYQIHPVLSIAHLIPYKQDKESTRNSLPPLRRDPKEYEVIRIVNQRRVKHGKKGWKTLYQCEWKDYGVTDEWVSELQLRNTPEVLQSWKEKLKISQRK